MGGGRERREKRREERRRREGACKVAAVDVGRTSFYSVGRLPSLLSCLCLPLPPPTFLPSLLTPPLLPPLSSHLPSLHPPSSTSLPSISPLSTLHSPPSQGDQPGCGNRSVQLQHYNSRQFPTLHGTNQVRVHCICTWAHGHVYM